MDKNAPSLFLCYAIQDTAFVKRLSNALKSAGLRIPDDELYFTVGISSVENINKAISDSDYVVVILSKAALASAWVDGALRIALLCNEDQQDAYVLPVLVEDCEIPPPLSGLNYADFRESEEAGLSELLATIGTFKKN